MVRIIGLCLALLPQVGRDSSYQSNAVRDLVRQVANHNRDVPGDLAAYSGRVESEVSLLRVDAAGSDRVLRVEQVALEVRWERDGGYREHAIGHRAQSSGVVTYDALRVPSFTVPLLYGNRFDLLLGPYGTSESAPATGTETTLDAVHPLAEGRERIYRFTGGDTTAHMRVGDRVITIARVHVEPVHVPAVKTTVFQGDLYVDLDRRQLVGMRGAILEIGGATSALKRLTAAIVRSVGYLEVFSSEVEGRYWIPGIERVELRVGSALATREQIRLRISSRFFDIAPETREAVFFLGDTLVAMPRRITKASVDSLARYAEWRTALGELTASEEFAQVSGTEEPNVDSAPLNGLHFGTRLWRHAVRFNRVEGLFTGIGLIGSAPTWASRTTATINGGRAWAERAWRGEMRVEQLSRYGTVGVSAGRYLESTNDFAYPADQGSLFSAVFLSRDDQDYVDRRKESVFAEHRWQLAEARLRVELAQVRDVAVSRRVQFGLVRVDSGFRPNRPASAWHGTKGSIVMELHPNVFAEFVRPGSGLVVRVEHGAGEPEYTRLEGRATVRRMVGNALVLSGRLDVGAVYSPTVAPLQELFELGGRTQLPGYDYKFIGGDRAVLGQVETSYSLRSFMLQRGGAALGQRLGFPQVSATLFMGAVSSSTAKVGSAVRSLEMKDGNCASNVECDLGWRARATAQLGVRLLDGGVFVGVRRRLSQRDRWHLAVSGTFF